MYIPNEWIKDRENEKEVHRILNDMNRDFIVESENFYNDGIEKLKKLKETIITEKINDGTIIFGA